MVNLHHLISFMCLCSLSVSFSFSFSFDVFVFAKRTNSFEWFEFLNLLFALVSIYLVGFWICSNEIYLKKCYISKWILRFFFKRKNVLFCYRSKSKLSETKHTQTQTHTHVQTGGISCVCVWGFVRGAAKACAILTHAQLSIFRMCTDSLHTRYISYTLYKKRNTCSFYWIPYIDTFGCVWRH